MNASHKGLVCMKWQPMGERMFEVSLNMKLLRKSLRVHPGAALYRPKNPRLARSRYLIVSVRGLWMGRRLTAVDDRTGNKKLILSINNYIK